MFVLSFSIAFAANAFTSANDSSLNGLNKCEIDFKRCNKSCEVIYDFYTEPVEYRKCLITCEKMNDLCLDDLQH